MKLIVLLFVAIIFAVEAGKVRKFQLITNEKYPAQPLPKRLKPTNRIIFGSNVSAMSAEKKLLYTHQVRLETQNINEEGFINACGGTLVSSSCIVTAAHCLKGSNYEAEYTDIYFGILSIMDSLSRSVVTRRVFPANFRIHKEWKPAVNNFNDIALIRLTNPVLPVPNKIAYGLLPNPAVCATNLEGKSVVISGFGLIEGGLDTEHLKSANTIIRSSDSCASYRSFRAAYSICAVGRDFENTCQGDSGGPMMFTNTNLQQYLVGVTSFGGNSCDDGSPSVYTKVCAYLDWIQDNNK